jgi:hypothetical protein
MKENLQPILEQDEDKLTKLIQGLPGWEMVDDRLYTVQMDFDLTSMRYPNPTAHRTLWVSAGAKLMPLPRDTGRGTSGTTFWWQLRVSVPASSQPDPGKSSHKQAWEDPTLMKVVDYLESLELADGTKLYSWAFKDEDAFGKLNPHMFSRPVYKFNRRESNDPLYAGTWTFTFLINPDFPLGYWENHSIEDLE